jgi:hypothetical protein
MSRSSQTSLNGCGWETASGDILRRVARCHQLGEPQSVSPLSGLSAAQYLLRRGIIEICPRASNLKSAVQLGSGRSV